MTDPHDRFQAWVVAFASGAARSAPARDVALHARACEACLADIAALDALAALDVGAADAPVASAAPPVARRVAWLRPLAGIGAASLLVVTLIVGVGALRDRSGSPGAVPVAEGTAAVRREGILGGVGGRAENQTPPATEEASARPFGTAGATGTPRPAAIGLGSTHAAPSSPPLIAPPPRVPGPAPSVPATPPATASPPAVASQTATPTGLPTPAALPTPSTPTPALPTPSTPTLPTPMPDPTPEPTPSSVLPSVAPP